MGNVFLHGKGGAGGGSGGFELTVVGGTVRPAKPTQNMIWANTPYEISSYIFSPTRPDAQREGMLWLSVANSGGIKLLSPVGMNWITVYPLSAAQYVNDAWMSIDVMSYQGHEWENWILDLAYAIVNCTSYVESGQGGKDQSITVENGVIIATTTGESSTKAGSIVYYSEDMFDLSKYSKLTFHAHKSNPGHCRIGFSSSNQSSFTSTTENTLAIKAFEQSAKNYEEDVTIDLTGVDVMGYFAINVSGYYDGKTYTNTVTLTDVKLIP